MIKFTNKRVIEVHDWDKLVTSTYGRTYNFQQQDGCQSRGTYQLDVSTEEIDDSDMPESVPEVVNGDEMGVRFSSWLSRDPNQPLPPHDGRDQSDSFMLELFWDRNFYPCIEVVANDLCRKGLIEAGEYTINIDW